MNKSLNGSWQFKEANENDWLNATVPGCNYLDLLKLGRIPDPFDGINEKDVYWVALKDWEYKKSFTVDTAEINYDKINLVCEMLDTICDVYINDALAGKGENAHLKYKFDVKPFLKSGENTVRVMFYSPVRYVEKKQEAEKCPRNWNGLDGIPHIRKPQCHFGWDWGPVLPPSGISRNIYVEFLNMATIDDILIKQTHSGDKVTLDVFAVINNLSGSALDFEVKVSPPNGDMIIKTGKCENSISETVVIDNPELWWTNDLSDKINQPLYSVLVNINRDGEIIDGTEKIIGLRTITLNREKDQYGSNFQFILNGVPLFIKGANWIPADSFINRFDEEKLKYSIDAALFSNMNMLRVWGGGYYESDEMYSMCDKAGILLWQDFCYACQPYPFFEEEFLENVKRETAYNVKRLRHHASLAVWCGNNEIEALSAAWPLSKKYIEWTEKFFYHILEPEIRKFDDATAYIPGSPCGVSHKAGFDKDNVGDTHLWAVWHGLQPMEYYRKRLTRFCSEFGFESLPDIKTIERFAKPEDYSLTSKVFKAHQKCMSGNMKMVYYIATRFRLPKQFVDFIYLSQVTQQECVADATEHWRRNKGRCNGSMYWQLNDCWPVCSWASMDYYGNYKALQYTSRHFNAPVSVSIENSKEKITIFVLNDKNEDIKTNIRYSVFDFKKGILKTEEKEIVIKALTNEIAFDLQVKEIAKAINLKQAGVIAELLNDNNLISRKTVLFSKEKNLKLPKALLSKSVKLEADKLSITLKSDCFARLVRVESLCSTLPFSDNYFDLLPGESKTITQTIDKTCKPGEQAEKITLFCCTDVEAKGSSVGDFLTRARIFLKPVNFVSWMYHRKIPKDYEGDFQTQ